MSDTLLLKYGLPFFFFFFFFFLVGGGGGGRLRAFTEIIFCLETNILKAYSFGVLGREKNQTWDSLMFFTKSSVGILKIFRFQQGDFPTSIAPDFKINILLSRSNH